ncbi:MAG: hypothetical protein HQL15_08775 [Candidatus Omnitrophica bacterium]|nr:hypothetical protein [Candidatus Omnitrophota bacterium]
MIQSLLVCVFVVFGVPAILTFCIFLILRSFLKNRVTLRWVCGGLFMLFVVLIMMTVVSLMPKTWHQ